MTIISTVIKNPGVLVGTGLREGMQNTTILTLSIQHRESGLGKGGTKRPECRKKQSRKCMGRLRSSWRAVKWQSRVTILSKTQRGGTITDFKGFGVFSFLQ